MIDSAQPDPSAGFLTTSPEAVFRLLDTLRPHIIAAYRNAQKASAHATVASAASSAIKVDDLPLTRRENEILYWVSMGKTNEEVGTIIDARRMTVKKHLEHIYDKPGVPNRTAAARLTVARPG